MKVMKKSAVAKYLEGEMIKWQAENGGLKTLKEFADYFGIETERFYKTMRGDRGISDDDLQLIAAKRGPEIWKIAGRVPPEIRQAIEVVPPDEYGELQKIIEDFLKSRGFVRTK